MVVTHQSMIRTYRELLQFDTFLDRFKYLQLGGSVGIATFGSDRYVNQLFYRSEQWKSVRNEIIIRDNGCDLGIEDRPIHGRIYIHHMNPLRVRDITDESEYLLNPDYLICCSYDTHQAIHYSNEELLIPDPIERTKNDTCPWKK